jgi:hypothetical protein
MLGIWGVLALEAALPLLRIGGLKRIPKKPLACCRNAIIVNQRREAVKQLARAFLRYAKNPSGY